MSSLTEDGLWKSLEDRPAQYPAAAAILNTLDHPLNRRRFLQLIGASAALAGISACSKMPAEKIIPYVVAPEEIIPGQALYFATASSFNGFSKSILAESHEGRPTKLEGNARDQSSLGKSDIFTQGELLQLYDPDRAKAVTYLGNISTWDAFSAAMLVEMKQWKVNSGEGVAILTEAITSPTVLKEIAAFLKRYPKAKWHSYEPVNAENTRIAGQLLFGEELRPVYDFTEAKVVVSLDGDFLGPGPSREIYARDFMSHRKFGNGETPDFNRLYMIDSSASLTGANADHRWPVKYSKVYELALGLAFLLGVKDISRDHAKEIPKWLNVVADDLKAHGGRGLIVAGDHQTPEVQALAFAMNESLGNLGKTLSFLPWHGDEIQTKALDIGNLAAAMKNKKVTTLFMIGGNPAYDVAASLDFKDNLNNVSLRVRLGEYDDETSHFCQWNLPRSHFLESWGDGRAYDGHVVLQQPLISPLYDTKSSAELFFILNEKAGPTGRDAVKHTASQLDQEPFEKNLSRGFLKISEPAISASVSLKLKNGWASGLSPVKNNGAIEAVFRPDPTIWDGRFANNAWLQELPKPLLQLTWSNVILMGVATAGKLELKDGDEIEIKINQRTVKGPVLRMPGHPDDSVTLYFGYGRKKAGRVGNNHGYDAFSVQDHGSPWFAPAVEIKKLGTKKKLAVTHRHSSMEGRDLVVHGDIGEYRKDPDHFVKEELKEIQPSLLPDYPYKENAWAMVIDLTTCIGCASCTVACQAENNIPVVGEDEVCNSREMHWIRVDRYFEGEPSRPHVYFQPVPCMHCEKAPCEEVCPTAATNHSSDGINQMIYNRCVGTRYCSNNCPYKVRRFNFFQYADLKEESKELMYNPDVTVRSRGVMEKCTYCVQRIQEARIKAEKENRPLRSHEIKTACQQACPTGAIVFGDKNDPNSQVAKLKNLPRNYSLLNELGTRPRTTYLAAISNPNPKLAAGAESET